MKSSESGCKRIFEELGSQTAEYLTLHESLKRYLNNYFRYCEFVGGGVFTKLITKIHYLVHIMSLYID